MPPFVRWGVAHLCAIALTFALPLLLAWWSRRDNRAVRTRVTGAAFALLLVGQITVLFFWLDRGAAPRWQDMLPLHVCDIVVFASALACLTRWQFAFEIAYFWGLAGTIHGLVTPDLDYGFPALQFWFFFLGHGGIIGAVIFLVAGFQMRPHPQSVGRAFGTILGYAAGAGLFNAAFNTNYGYLCGKPGAPSLLDLLGPWPWYIASLIGVAMISFVLLYLPWWALDASRRRA